MRGFLKKVGGALLILGVGLSLMLMTDIKILLSEPVDIYADEPAGAEELKAGMAIDDASSGYPHGQKSI